MGGSGMDDKSKGVLSDKADLDKGSIFKVQQDIIPGQDAAGPDMEVYGKQGESLNTERNRQGTAEGFSFGADEAGSMKAETGSGNGADVQAEEGNADGFSNDTEFQNLKAESADGQEGRKWEMDVSLDYGTGNHGRNGDRPLDYGTGNHGRNGGMPSGCREGAHGRNGGRMPYYGQESRRQNMGMPPSYGHGQNMDPQYGYGGRGGKPDGAAGRMQEPGRVGYYYDRNSCQYPEQGGYEQELEAPLTVGEWLINMLLMLIPCVNIILMLVWAFGDKEKKSKSNYYKARLIFSGILIGILFLWACFYGMAALFLK